MAAIVVVGFLVALSGAGIVVAVRAGQGAAAIGLSIAVGGRGVLLLWHRWSAGALLLDVGRSTPTLLPGWGDVVFAVLGLVLVLAIAPVLALYAVSALPLSLFVEFASRVRIRERGVIAGARYIRWERIYCYALDEVYDVVHGVGAMVQMDLVIEYQPLWSLWRQVTVPCPAEASEEVAHLMAQYAPSERKRPPPVRTKRKRP